LTGDFIGIEFRGLKYFNFGYDELKEIKWVGAVFVKYLGLRKL